MNNSSYQLLSCTNPNHTFFRYWKYSLEEIKCPLCVYIEQNNNKPTEIKLTDLKLINFKINEHEQQIKLFTSMFDDENEKDGNIKLLWNEIDDIKTLICGLQKDIKSNKNI
jgi:hypothetical protein